MKTIHCIGDSHVSVFMGRNKIAESTSRGAPYSGDCIKPFRTYWMGPYLAYSLGDKNHKVIKEFKIILNGIPKTDILLLSFGEIDCRVHIVTQAKIQKKTIEQVSYEVADRYAAFVKDIMSLGYQVIIYAPVPSSNKYDPTVELTKSNEKKYPHIGSTQDRNKATVSITKRLLEHFPEGIVVSLLKELLNDDYTTKIEYFMDDVHLAQKALPLIQKAIEDLGIEL